MPETHAGFGPLATFGCLFNTLASSGEELMPMPLDGIRILDCTIWQQGPVATTMLADLGADVIKIEEPTHGDPGRGVLKVSGLITSIPTGSGRNYYFENNNRNKRAITLDLKHPKGKEALFRLVEKSDVFVQNLRHGVAAQMGIDYKMLSRYNPKLIYASGSGYGTQGPDATRPAMDYLGLARSGFMTQVGEPDQSPLYPQGGIADQMGAVLLTSGVVTALLARERFGIGQEVDVSLLGSMVALEGLSLAARLILGQSFKRNYRTKAGNPLWNHYRCGDGKWIAFAMLQDRSWSGFCKALGIEGLEKDPRFSTLDARGKNREELIAILDKMFATKPRAEWMSIFDKSGADNSFSQINDVDDLPDDPQVKANRYIEEFTHPEMGQIQVVGLPIKFSKTPGSIRREAPQLGQHTEEVLTEIAGYSWEEVAKLRDEKAI